MTLLLAAILAGTGTQPLPTAFIQERVAKTFADPKTWDRAAKADVLLTKHQIFSGAKTSVLPNVKK